MIPTLQRAGARLAALDAAEVFAGLGRVLDAFADAASPERRGLAAELPATTRLSRATIEAGLDLALTDWNASALERLVEHDLGSLPEAPLPGVTTVVHGGVIPMPTLSDLLAPLLLRSPVLSRPGRHDPVTPRWFLRSLAERAPDLAEALAIAPIERADERGWETALATERVCVTGSDAAVDGIRARLAAGTRLLAHGHKLSVAWLGPQAGDLDEAAMQLATDVALWDQLGCLSPVACWVVGPEARTQGFAAALAEALNRREAAWPRGAIDARAAAHSAHERAEAEMRGAVDARITLHAGDAWTVVAEADASPRPTPLHRFVRVHPVADLTTLRDALAPWSPILAGVALHGFADDAGAETAAHGLGATRTAPFGRLQAPPLHWARDGLAPLSALISRS